MKRIKTFNELSESLSTSRKVKPADVEKLAKLATDKSEDFAEAFDQTYGAASEMWMSEDDIAKLMKLYASRKYEFTCVSGESTDGANDTKIEQMEKKGWIKFADEQNEDSYDCILYKKK